LNIIEKILVPNLSQATGAMTVFAGRSGDAWVDVSNLFIKQWIVPYERCRTQACDPLVKSQFGEF
jgi:hypothetical protein